ncbi:hypothetical protein BH11CYA1_BH11CYA1_49130 [soil metagenome]
MHFRWSGLLLIALLAFCYLLPSQSAQAERINDFQVDLALSENGLLKVTETIRYDFEKVRRSAIYRRIPVHYKRNGKVAELAVNPLSVKDGTKYAPYSCRLIDGVAVLQIGDGKKPLSGLHIFRIHYDVSGAVNTSSTVPELVWNCLGSGWSCPVDTITVNLHLPPNIDLAAAKTLSYLGSSPVRSNSVGRIVGNIIQFSGSQLHSGQDFSCLATLPPILIQQPSFTDQLYLTLLYWRESLLVPAITFVLLSFLWLIYGRDPISLEATEQWQPPCELTPAELGTLIDEHCDKHDITLTLLDLAARGYLIISEVPHSGLLGRDDKDYCFKKAASPDPERLKPHEVLLLSSMFVANSKTHLSTLRGQYKEHMTEMRNMIYQSLVRDRYFVRLPQKDRNSFIVVGFLILAVGAMLLVTGAHSEGLNKQYGVGFVFSSLMIFIASATMPKRTKKAVTALRQAKTFIEFASSGQPAEFERIAQEEPGAFGRYLPYACVLGCAEKWANHFTGLLEEGPNYFRFDGSDLGPDEESFAKFDSQNFTYGVSLAMAAINLSLDSSVVVSDDLSSGHGHS